MMAVPCQERKRRIVEFDLSPAGSRDFFPKDSQDFGRRLADFHLTLVFSPAYNR